MRHRLRTPLILSALVALAGFFGCGGVLWTVLNFTPLGGEDSWRHYASGGSFSTDSPSLSDDGAEIVFATPATGHGDIYIADVRTGAARRLTSSKNCELSPYFLPGSRQIVFQREQVPSRHIWMLDLDSGEERQLTTGRYLDDILSVSPSGKQVLINRSELSYGLGREVRVHMLDVAAGSCLSLGNCLATAFADGGRAILGTQGAQPAETFRFTPDGKLESKVADGSVIDVNDSCQAAIVLDPSTNQGPDYEMYAVDLLTNETARIGRGSRPCMFVNGKVLFFVTFLCQGRIWERGEGQPRECLAPAGYIVTPNRSRDGKSAVLFVMPPDHPKRLYDIYLFDSEVEKFTRVNVRLPTPGDSP